PLVRLRWEAPARLAVLIDEAGPAELRPGLELRGRDRPRRRCPRLRREDREGRPPLKEVLPVLQRERERAPRPPADRARERVSSDDHHEERHESAREEEGVEADLVELPVVPEAGDEDERHREQDRGPDELPAPGQHPITRSLPPPRAGHRGTG